VVTDVRGRGLLWGIELRSQRHASLLAKKLLERGVIALSGGAAGNVVQLCPPLTITAAQLDFALDAVAHSLPLARPRS
jgi:4-aminobutyrate aminotransferase-like enzyme